MVGWVGGGRWVFLLWDWGMRWVWDVGRTRRPYGSYVIPEVGKDTYLRFVPRRDRGEVAKM